MVSEEQKKANEENAKLGGVKTPEGKEVSKLNATKHGIFKVELSDYEKSDVVNVQQFVIDEYQPVGFEQNLLANRIANHLIRLARINKSEIEFMKAVMDPTEEFIIDWNRHEGYKPVMNHENVRTLNDTYLRYQTTLENRLDKAISQLKKLQQKNSE